MSTSAYFKSNSYIDGGTITNVDITSSTLDMDLNRITSVQDPIDPQDAVTKKYIDDKLNEANITLTQTNYTLISTLLKGAYMLTINAIIEDGPVATFHIAKSKNTKQAHIVRLTSAPGDSSLEQLEVRWLPSTGIELHKTGLNYDGLYTVKIL